MLIVANILENEVSDTPSAVASKSNAVAPKGTSSASS